MISFTIRNTHANTCLTIQAKDQAVSAIIRFFSLNKFPIKYCLPKGLTICIVCLWYTGSVKVILCENKFHYFISNLCSIRTLVLLISILNIYSLLRMGSRIYLFLLIKNLQKVYSVFIKTHLYNNFILLFWPKTVLSTKYRSFYLPHYVYTQFKNLDFPQDYKMHEKSLRD